MAELDPGISNYLRAGALRRRDHYIQASTAAERAERDASDKPADKQSVERTKGGLALRMSVAARRITGTERPDDTAS